MAETLNGEVVNAEAVDAEVINAEVVETVHNAPEKLTNGEVMSLAVLSFDEADAQQIELMLKGVVSDKLVYRFTAKDGSEVKGLSVVGVRSAVHYLNAHKQAQIRINDDLKIDFREINGETWVIATVSASDAYGNRWFGAAQQPVNITRKDGTVTVDPFAVAKVVSKAQRNALRGLFPEPIVVELIDLWTKEGKVMDLEESDVPQDETPQPTQQTPQPTQQTPKIEITDNRSMWRQVYRLARALYGDAFKDKLRQIIKERYDSDRLELPNDALADLISYLEAEKAALGI